MFQFMEKIFSLMVMNSYSEANDKAADKGKIIPQCTAALTLCRTLSVILLFGLCFSVTNFMQKNILKYRKLQN